MPKEEVVCTCRYLSILHTLVIGLIDILQDHEWKNAFFIQILTPVLEAIVAVDFPNYSYIINLDKMVRDFEIPAVLDEQYNHDVRPRFLVMQRALVSMGRDIGIISLLLKAKASSPATHLQPYCSSTAASSPKQ